MASWRFTKGRVQKINSSKFQHRVGQIYSRLTQTSSVSTPTRRKKGERKTHAVLNNCRIFCESNLCIFSCLEQMYTKQWWPPLSFSMGLGWCAPLLSGNCCSSISNIKQNARNSIVCRHWETCNLRVTWPTGSHHECPVEHADRQTRNESRYTLLRAKCVCLCDGEEGQMCYIYNDLTSFVLLIIIRHLRERNKGCNHGYSENALRKRRMKTNITLR